ncbi:outer membrane protein [Methylocystis heyeri]|nr:outer membrane beta-barrel protein [Methylocystis heyeri]
MRVAALGISHRAQRIGGLRKFAPVLTAVLLVAHDARADEAGAGGTSSPRPAPPPVPLCVFGDALPGAGKLLLTLSPQFSGNANSLVGARGVSSQQIVATTPWYWSPLSTLRLVPQRLLTESQTATLAYGLRDDLSLVLNAGLIEKHIDLMTFYGASGIIPRGMSNPGTESLQDTQLSGIWRVYQDPIHRIQLNLGMSFPTGSDHNLATPFQPTGTWATARAFYAMQTGTGTFDIMPGILYAGALAPWSWGLSYRARLPLGVNPEGYMWGNYQEWNAWAGYTWVPGFTTTVRVNGNIQDHIVGADWWVIGKIQTGDPDFFGGKRIELFGGASIDGKIFGYPGFSLLAEAGIPVYQNLNGPQLAKNWQATMGLRWKVGDGAVPGAAPGLPALKDSPDASSPFPVSWSGLYFGVNAGYGWSGDNSTNFRYFGSGGFVDLWASGAVPSGFRLNSDGFVGGAQLGYNYQLSDKFVGGVETEIDGVVAGVNAANWLAASPLAYVQGLRSQHSFGSVRARLGYLATPALLAYATGGLAYGETDLSAAWFSPALKPALNAGGSWLGYQDLRTGWVGGAGVEWMFLPKWSAKLEYLYYDLQTATTLPLQAVYGSKGRVSSAYYQARFNGDIVRVGVNYHFNFGAPAPATAKF